MPSKMDFYSLKFHVFAYHSPSEALSKDAISSGMVPSPPKEHIMLYFFLSFANKSEGLGKWKSTGLNKVFPEKCITDLL